MQKYKNSIQLCFDDILIVPATYSSVSSRYSVDLTMKLGVSKRPEAILELSLPIIASPMDTVCEWEMAKILSENGALGIIHRFMSVEDRIIHLQRVNGLVGVAISLIEACDSDIVGRLIDAGARVLCVDTANGHASRALDAVKKLRSIVEPHIHIMSGNVATYEAFSNLITAGADSVRVGIGGGSACTTRLVSGHGMPTLASILDCVDHLYESDDQKAGVPNSEYMTAIIADGGIRTTGDMIKSFAAGAGAVMLGSMLSGYAESPGEIFHDSNGRLVKQFRGMASKEAQEDWLGGVSVSEGVSTIVPFKGAVHDILQSIKGGLGSGCSYSNCTSLSDMYYIANYVQVSASSIEESIPHSTITNSKTLANFNNKNVGQTA